MTRFLHITDTHLGGNNHEGFMQQPRCLEHWNNLLQEIKNMVPQYHLDFMIHGGDATDHGTYDEIQQFVHDTESLPCPIYLSLGNHDLQIPDAIKIWQNCTSILPGGKHSYSVVTSDCILVVLGIYWDQLDKHYWDITGTQIPLISTVQKKMLREIAKDADRPVVIALHAPLNSIPSSQTGLNEDIHLPDNNLRNYFLELATEFPCIKLFLCGHNHAHTIENHGHFITATTSAFTEYPFEMRLISIDKKHLTIETITCMQPENCLTHYNHDKSWVQGNAQQRELKL